MTLDTQIRHDTVGDEPPAAGTRARRLGPAAFLAPLLAAVLGWGLDAWRHSWSDAFSTLTYRRWDSAWYLIIANQGYSAGQCAPGGIPPGAPEPASQYLCGSVGWFPGYPAVLRGLAEVTTLSLPVAGLIVAWVAWYFLLFFVWQLLDGARSPWTRWACLLLAAWFPSQIYFAAVFPISLTIAAMLGSVFFAIVKRRPIPAAILGIVAGASYVSGAVVAPALLLTSLVCQKGRQRVAAIAGGLGAVAGLAVVPLYAHAAVGKWNAYVLTKKPYGQGVNNPLVTIHHRLEPLWTTQDVDHRYLDATAAQTLLVGCITVLVLAATLIGMRKGPVELRLAGSPGWWRRTQAWIISRITVVDLSLVVLVAGAAVVPLITGGPASIGSTARNETFVVVGVPLLRKLPVYLLMPVLAAAAFIAWRMAGHFYQNKLF